jgi:glycosyltransferase involved in cell wall biosynthesis
MDAAIEILGNSPPLDAAWRRQASPDPHDRPEDVARRYLERGARNGRNRHPLFDSSFYLEQNPDVAERGLHPLTHYLVHGAKEGRDPHPLFDTSFYLEQNSEAATSGMNPLAHYILHGAKEGADPHPLFDTKFYLEQNPDVAASGLNPLIHFILYGAKVGHDPSRMRGEERNPNPHPLFDTKFYLEQNSAATASGMNPLAHYILHGAEERADPHPLFDTKFYLEQNPDVAASGSNPLIDFILYGARMREGRNPNALFDTDFYLTKYPEVKAAGTNPLVHYLSHGADKSYNPHPLFDTDWYLAKYPEVAARGLNPLAHFVHEGRWKKYNPCPLFDTAWYLDKNPVAASSDLSPFEHYLTCGAAEGLDPSPLFDTKWYLSQCGDTGGINPLVHFLETGVSENLDPNPMFDVDWYLAANPDVEAAGQNPLVHYSNRGGSEGRAPSLFFESSWYLRKYVDVAESGINPLAHYLAHGASEGRSPYDASATLAGMKIAVVAHCFYEDVWRQIVKALKNIPIDFDLFVTIPKHGAAGHRAAISRSQPSARIFEVENAGRDVGAFVSVMPFVLERNYAAVCKIHTKKGSTEPDTWRFLLLQSVLGSPHLVSNILRAFHNDPDLWIVGAKDFYISGPIFSSLNSVRVKRIAEELYPSSRLPDNWGFFAGTMFWARPEMFSALVRLINDRWEFENDSTANDGQLAHALERIFGLIPTIRGKRIGLTNIAKIAPVPAVFEVKQLPAKPVTEEIAFYLKRRAVELSHHLPVSPTGKSSGRQWTPRPGAELGVNLIGPVEFVNGVAVHARGIAASLAASGVKLNVIPWRPGFDRLLTVPGAYPSLELQEINLVHLNLDLISSAQLLDCAPLDDIVSPERYNILMFFWELTAYPAEWLDVVERFDEIWVASSFLARGISAVTKVPVRVMRAALKLEDGPATLPRARFGLPDDRFVFFYSADAGSVLGRKNPKALLDAYLEEFAEDEGACCLLKVHYAQSNDPFIVELIAVTERRSDVMFIDQILDENDLHELVGLIDCYVSPHRTEGLGLTILEAMAAEKPVIATNHGGSTDFVTPETAIPIDYRLVEVGDGNAPYSPTFIWADPIEDSLRRAMRSLFTDRQKAASLGRAGRRKVCELFSTERTAKEMKRELQRIWFDQRRGPTRTLENDPWSAG